MKRTAAIATLVLTGCGAFVVAGGQFEPDSEISVYPDVSACTAGGLDEASCAGLFQAADERADGTANLYEEAADCAKDHGLKGCRGVVTTDEVPRLLFRAAPAGVAVMSPIGHPGRVLDAEPVYPCAAEETRACHQSLTGRDFIGPVQRKPVRRREFAGEYRYAERAPNTSLADVLEAVVRVMPDVAVSDRTPSTSRQATAATARTPTTAATGLGTPARIVSPGRSITATGRVVQSGGYRSFRSVAGSGLGSTARGLGARSGGS